MKLQRSLRVAVVLFAAQNAFSASATTASQNPFWEKVSKLIQQCSEKTVNGPLRSTCAEVQVKGSQAQFNLEGEWYLASIADSADSDGGDLNDVTVQNRNGVSVAERHNTLAFGDILVGLAGGQVQSAE